MRSRRCHSPRLTGGAAERGLTEVSRKGLGMTVVVDRDDLILGVFTDGDLRRALDKAVDVRKTPIAPS